MCVFYWILDSTLLNAHVIYNHFEAEIDGKDKSSQTKFKDFVHGVILEGLRSVGCDLKDLIPSHLQGNTDIEWLQKRVSLRGDVEDPAALLRSVPLKHLSLQCEWADPIRIKERGYKNRTTNCVWCWNHVDKSRRHRHGTAYMCAGCNTPLGLHCFRPWHMYLACLRRCAEATPNVEASSAESVEDTDKMCDLLLGSSDEESGK